MVSPIATPVGRVGLSIVSFLTYSECCIGKMVISTVRLFFSIHWRLLLSWSYGSWIYNYLRNHCLLLLTLWVWIPLRRGVLDTALCEWLAAGWWFSPGTSICFANKTDSHDIAEILLNVALNTITLTLTHHPFSFINISILFVFSKISEPN